MRRFRSASALVLWALARDAAADGGAVARTTPRRFDRRVPKALSLKLDVGPELWSFYDHSIVGGSLAFAFGAQFDRAGAVHVFGEVFSGETQFRLRTNVSGLGITWEMPIARVRPGFGLAWRPVSIERATTPDRIEATMINGLAFMTCDLITTPHAALFLGTRLEHTVLVSGRPDWGGALSAGGRFVAF